MAVPPGAGAFYLLLAMAVVRERGPPVLHFELLPAESLRSHEATNPLVLRQTIESIRREGCLRRPILVEGRHHIILDGHHRYEALRALGCRRIPAYVVDYFDPAVELTTWPGAIVKEISKEEVVRQVLERKLLFPPKTTRHIVHAEMPERPIPLADLM